MPPRCSVCSHPRVRDINDDLAAGASSYDVASTYGLSASAVQRHWRNCVPEDVAEAVRAGHADGIDALDGAALVSAMRALVVEAGELFSMLKRGYEAGTMSDARAMVSALGQATAAVEKLAKLSFMVQDRPQRMEDDVFPEIDALILRELEKRGYDTAEARAAEARRHRERWQPFAEPPELGPAVA